MNLNQTARIVETSYGVAAILSTTKEVFYLPFAWNKEYKGAEYYTEANFIAKGWMHIGRMTEDVRGIASTPTGAGLF